MLASFSVFLILLVVPMKKTFSIKLYQEKTFLIKINSVYLRRASYGSAGINLVNVNC